MHKWQGENTQAAAWNSAGDVQATNLVTLQAHQLKDSISTNAMRSPAAQGAFGSRSWVASLQELAVKAEAMHRRLAVASVEDSVSYLALLQEHSAPTWEAAEMMKRVGAHERAVLAGEAPRRPLVSTSRSFKGRQYEVSRGAADGAHLGRCCRL